MQTPHFSRTRLFFCALAVIATAYSLPGRAGPTPEIWVGAGANCDYATLQEAIDSLPTDGSDTNVRVADDQAYDNQALTIEDHSLHLVGGYAECEGTDNGGRTVIHGDGLSPVISVFGNAGQYYVGLLGVDITGGNSAQGGGLAVGGHAYVNMIGTRIYGNTATSGGGVSVDGTTGPSWVDINLGSDIGAIDAPNTAVNGAGVHCREGILRMRRVTVSYNVASGDGGGIHLDHCTLDAYGAQPDADGNHLDYNEADSGGAIFAINASEIRLGVESGRTDFLGNHAAASGGAFYLRGEDSFAALTASRFESNSAGQLGGAIFATDHAFFRMERGHTEPLLCPQFPCSALISNSASEGSVAYARAQGRIDISESVVTQSGASSPVPVFVANGAQSLLLLSNVLVHGMSGEGLLLSNGGIGSVRFATFAGNDFTSDLHLGTGSPTLLVQNSIFWDAPATVLVSDGAASVEAWCNTVHENTSFPGVTDDPLFVDAAAQNYRLRGNSPNVDACGSGKATVGVDGTFILLVDVDGAWRPVDLAPANGDGPYDRGAHELQDPIFANGFESF